MDETKIIIGTSENINAEYDLRFRVEDELILMSLGSRATTFEGKVLRLAEEKVQRSSK